MINLTQEILNLQEHGYHNTIKQLRLIEQEIKEKKYMLSVHYALTYLKEIIENKDFNKENVFFISIKRESGLVYFNMLDDKNDVVINFEINGEEYLLEVRKVFHQLHPYNDLVSDNFTEKEDFLFSLDDKGLNELKNSLLSDKLKASLNYALMDTQLSEKPADNRKMKI